MLALEAWEYCLPLCAFIEPKVFLDGKTIINQLQSGKLLNGCPTTQAAFLSFWNGRHQSEKGGAFFVYKKFRQHRSSFTQRIVSTRPASRTR